jgi:AbrB family looped-hinge helix DNA binding protein
VRIKLSTKGQVILPQSLRRSRRWDAGTEFSVEEVPEGVLLRPVRPFPSTTVDEVSGCLKYHGRPKTLAEMDQAITREVRTRHACGRY